MTEEVSNLILYFSAYSILGYILEITLCSLNEKKLVNRGFLFGPWIPVYGFGMLLVLGATFSVKENFTLTFLTSTLVCSLLEYFTSWLMEKLFHIKWWDYSKTDKYNLNGRICLRNCLAFGIAGSLIVYQLHPLVSSLINLIPALVRISLASFFIIIYLFATLLSSYAVLKAKKVFDFSKIVGDQTNEIKRQARKVIKELLRRKKKVEKELEKKRKKFEREIKRRIK